MSLRDTMPLEARKVTKKTIASIAQWAPTVLFLVFLGVFWRLSAESRPITEMMSSSIWLSGFLWGVVVLLVFALFSYFHQHAYFKSYFYDANEDMLTIRKGVFAPGETNLLFKKINDVYVDQDILDQMFGLYDVHFSTASDRSALAAHIDGLSRENADKLKGAVLSKIKQQTTAQTGVRV